jgi:hypothetical protein
LKVACQRHWDTTPYSYNEAGLRLFKGQGEKGFNDVTKTAGLNQTVGQGAAGFTFLDYNSDGLMDIYLANGLWSGNPEGDDVSSLFLIGLAKNHEKMRMGLKDNATGFKEYLRAQQGSISADGKVTNMKGMNPNLLGYQHNRLMRNNGDGTFTDVAFMEGVDSIADGYIVGNVINADGSPDLVLRNGDPGATTTKAFPVVQYFRNGRTAKDKSIQLTFEGTRSNKDAIGTFVIATFKNGSKQVQHLVANSGSLQNERKLRFVSSSKIPTLEIHWPSGTIQKMKNVTPGTYMVKEDNPEILQTEI